MKISILAISSLYFIICFFMGHLVNCLCYRENQGVLRNIFTGVFSVWAIQELLLVPMTFAKVPFRTFAISYAVILAAACAASLFFHQRLKRILSEAVKSWKDNFSWTVLAAVFLILLQLYYVHNHTYYEWDDAFYINVANDAIQSNVLLGIVAETGVGYAFPMRYAFSLWPIHYAFIGLLTQISPTIIAHTVLPFVIIPFAYLVYNLMARTLFPGDSQVQGYFLLFGAILHMFMTQVHFISGSYLLLTPWVGKAILACVVLPAVVYQYLQITKDTASRGDWIILFLFTLGSCLLSSMGIMLLPVFMGSLGLLHALRNRQPSFFLKSVLSCIPCLILGICYLMLT